MDIGNIGLKKIHFIGIAGVGMSALAQLMADAGARVTGSDNAWFPTLKAVERRGIPVVIGYEASNIPEDAELVVYTDAAHADNAEREEATRRNIPQVSYFAMLGKVSAALPKEGKVLVREASFDSGRLRLAGEAPDGRILETFRTSLADAFGPETAVTVRESEGSARGSSVKFTILIEKGGNGRAS